MQGRVRREELTALLRRAKTVLNIHFYPAKVLEICRIVEAISFGALVRGGPGLASSGAALLHAGCCLAMQTCPTALASMQAPCLCEAALEERTVPGRQVVSEPGADAVLDAQWDGKVVFAEGVPALAEQLQLYRCAWSRRACTKAATQWACLMQAAEQTS